MPMVHDSPMIEAYKILLAKWRNKFRAYLATRNLCQKISRYFTFSYLVMLYYWVFVSSKYLEIGYFKIKLSSIRFHFFEYRRINGLICQTCYYGYACFYSFLI